MMQRFRSFSPVSVAVTVAVVNAVMGLVIGALISLASLAIPSAGLFGGGNMFFPAMGGMAASIIILPLVYGVLGFIGGLICAWVYNLVARVTGGLVVELA
jgi:hypothetical protein